MSVLAININNTNTQHGLVCEGRVSQNDSFSTKLLEDPQKGILPILQKHSSGDSAVEGLAFGSVVPQATVKFRDLLSKAGWAKPIYQITCENCPLEFNFPDVREIGQDILANAVAGKKIYGTPVVVIDMGTAVTFDIVSSKGYEGGIIAPGLAVITRYLHERTALLPELDPNDLMVSAGIGKTTVEAMKLGCAVGFEGMIRALLDRVLRELGERGEGPVKVVATGGSAGMLPQTWLSDIEFNPHITLLGMAEAYARQ